MHENDDTDTQSLRSDQTQPTPPRRNSVFHRMWKRGYRAFPSLIPDPDHKHILAIYQRNDDEDNAKTDPPDDESIDMHCIWAVEFYTPAHVDKLLSGFRSLGWDKEDFTSLDRNPALWIQSLRETPHGGGWFNLGLISRPGETRFIGDRHLAPLPQHVEYALGAIHGLTSSLTCIVVDFVFDDQQSCAFDVVLRRTHETYTERIKRGYRILTPFSQKHAGIRAVRADIRATATNWFRAHLPGLFSSGILEQEFPTCEFVTLRQGRPFPKREAGAPRVDEYLRLLDLDHDFDAWRCGDSPGLTFAWPSLRDRDNRFHAIVAANEKDLDNEDVRMYGGAGRSAYVAYIDRRVNGLLSRWALLAALSGFERHLNTIRDSTTFRPRRRQKTLSLLTTLSELVSQSIDLAAVCSELNRYAESPYAFAHEVEAFKPLNPKYYGNQEITLHELLREQIKERAGWLESTDRSVRDLLIQYGTVLGTREDIKVQRSLGRLTIFIAALTAMLAFFAVHESEAWPGIARTLSQLVADLFYILRGVGVAQ